jgi:zinc-ribbon domain
MAAFCSSCGGKLETGAKFCMQCGQAVANAPSAAAQPAASTPAGGGGAVKIILVVLGVIGFCVVLATGSCFYIGYRIKKRAHEISQSYALNSTPYRGKRDACALITKAEVSQAFGMPVESVSQGGDSDCQFRFAGNGSRQLAINVTWEGGTLAMKLSHGAMKSISGMETFTPVAGLGDEAYVEPMGSGLMMRKSDVMVNIDLRLAGNDADAAKKIGAKIAGRL